LLKLFPVYLLILVATNTTGNGELKEENKSNVIATAKNTTKLAINALNAVMLEFQKK
jgi:hypothetical protein